MTDDDLVRRFERARPRLRAIARRLLGSDADAEDAVQEAWLRVERAPVDSILDVDAWLTTVVSRISLDVLRAPRRRREHSWEVEAWGREPAGADDDPAALAETAERVDLAVRVVLETLSPVERVCFVLHDLFGQPFDDVAELVGKSPAAVRQLTVRARRRLRDAGHRTDGRRAERRLVDAWLVAVRRGDLAAILALLHDDAVLTADLGRSTQVVQGGAAIAEQAVWMAELAANSTPVLVDGMPAVAARADDRLASLMVFGIVGGRVSSLEVLADPERLSSLRIPL